MAFTNDEKELLLDVLDRAIYESGDEIEGIERYLNYLRSDAVFKGKIFYAILLDSCEDIHEQSLSVFRTLFENQIIIE